MPRDSITRRPPLSDFFRVIRLFRSLSTIDPRGFFRVIRFFRTAFSCSGPRGR